MFARLLILIFGFTAALCQASYKSQPYEKFKYWGCATVNAAGFSNPVPLPNGVLTPEMCQAACVDHMFAAVSPNACRCGDDPNAIKSINEGFCNNPCSEDPYSPMCGGGCSEDNSDISNLFVIQNAAIHATESQSELGNPENQLAPSTVVITITSRVSFASAALGVQTSSSSSGQDEVAPSQPPIVEPTEIASPLPSSAFVPVDPPATSPGQLLESTSTSTVQAPSSLTWLEDEPPTTPEVDPDSLSDGSKVLSALQTESPTSEVLVTDTGSVPTPSPTVSQVGVSAANRFKIPLMVTLSELLLIAVMLV